MDAAAAESGDETQLSAAAASVRSRAAAFADASLGKQLQASNFNYTNYSSNIAATHFNAKASNAQHTCQRNDARRKPVDLLLAASILGPPPSNGAHSSPSLANQQLRLQQQHPSSVLYSNNNHFTLHNKRHTTDVNQNTALTFNQHQNAFANANNNGNYNDDGDCGDQRYEANKLRSEEALYRSRLKSHQLNVAAAMNRSSPQALNAAVIVAETSSNQTTPPLNNTSSSKPPALNQTNTQLSNSKKQQQQQQTQVNFKSRGQNDTHNNATIAAAAAADDDELDDGERKKKYFTAKYGQHQMSLIKKRLKIEMWLHDELLTLARKLVSGGSASEAESLKVADDIEIEIDELLDTSDDASRAQILQETLSPLHSLVVDTKQTARAQKLIDEYIETILQQVKLL